MTRRMVTKRTEKDSNDESNNRSGDGGEESDGDGGEESDGYGEDGRSDGDRQQ